MPVWSGRSANLTNRLRDSLSGCELLERRDPRARFDVMVVADDGREDLLIEVKSSAEKRT